MAADKTIEVKVRFWTDKLGSGGQVRQRHARSSGNVPANSLHGIKAGEQVNFETIGAQEIRTHAGDEARSRR